MGYYGLRCIVIGRKGRIIGPKDDQEYYVLIIKQLSWINNAYERVGVGSIQERYNVGDRVMTAIGL